MKLALVLVVFLLLAIPSMGSAQSQGTHQQPLTPLEKALNPDGTINMHSGFSGSLDPKGYRLVYGKNGAPQFVRATESSATVAADSSWDDKFGYPGTNGDVNVVAVSGANVYIGGGFTLVHNIKANSIAKWNGSTWSALGSGFSGLVYGIAISGTDVYVCGTYTAPDYSTSAKVSKWNGSTWSNLGSGLSTSPSGYSTAQAIAVNGTDVYVGGIFNTAGGGAARNIAKWNGSSWSALGVGVSGGNYGSPSVNAIAVSGGNVYVGGGFDTAGIASARGIAKWDGSAWSALGTGMMGYAYGYPVVEAVAVSGSDIYIGGMFDTVGGVAISSLAKWDGATWSALGTGVNGGVRAITVNGTDVYVGGPYTAGGTSVNGIARWNGSNWLALGTGCSVNAIGVSGSDVYVVGSFKNAGGVNASGIAKWDGSSWRNVASGSVFLGLNGTVNSFCANGGDLYVGGQFNNIPSINSIGKFTGFSWSDVGGGINGLVRAISVLGDFVYLGGDGLSIGPYTSGLYQWSSSAGWNLFFPPQVPMGVVHAIAVSDTDLYVAGIFYNHVQNIQMWNGTSLSYLGTGIGGGGGYPKVDALVMIGTNLYVGGYFSTAGGVAVNNIAKWDGSTWSTVGDPSGANGEVTTLATSGGILYAGGTFTSIGGVSASRIAMWNGSTWFPLSSGLSTGGNDYPWAIATSGTDVYVGGTFTTAGGVSAKNIAKWNGSTWSALGSGVDTTVLALCVVGPDLYVGGNFLNAGGKSSYYWGRWRIPKGCFSAAKQQILFDTVTVTWSKMDSVDVNNTGYASLTIDSVRSLSSEFTVTPTSGIITTSGTMKFYVTFSPNSVGGRASKILFWHNGSTSPDTVAVTGVGDLQPTLLFTMNNRWNLVSIPLTMANDSVRFIYPTSVPFTAYGYQGNYVPQETLAYGRGYWLKFARTQTVSIRGYWRSTDTITVSSGWNLVGSISHPVRVDSVTSSPPGIVTSQFFGYANGYKAVDTIQPSKGYWVKANQSGSLILTSSGSINPVNRIRISQTNEKPPTPPEEVAQLTEFLPKEFALKQNYPNPFNPSTVIRYQLPVNSRVTLRIYNVLGQIVRTLVNEVQDAGYKTAEFDGGNVTSGIYFYQFEATSLNNAINSYTFVKKMLLIK